MKRVGITVLAISVCAGCASGRDVGLASRFIRHGTPVVDLGGPELANRPVQRELPRHTGRPTSVSRVSSGALEASDPKLRHALANLMFAPTVANHLDVARAYRRLGIQDHALAYLEKSVEVNGPTPVVYEAIARLWRDWGVPRLGLTPAHRAVYLAPESGSAHNTLGTVLHQLGQVSEAKAEFEKALALNPSAWYALANLCHISLAQGHTREAIAQCRRAETLRKQNRAAKVKE